MTPRQKTFWNAMIVVSFAAATAIIVLALAIPGTAMLALPFAVVAAVFGLSLVLLIRDNTSR